MLLDFSVSNHVSYRCVQQVSFSLTHQRGQKKKSIPNASEHGQRSLLFMGVAQLDEINSTVYFHAWSAEMMFKICAGFW